MTRPPLLGQSLRFASLSTYATLLVFLALLCGCGHKARTTATGRTLDGRIECHVPPQLGQGSFTNFFHIFIGADFYLLKLSDANEDVRTQLTYDGQDMGFWSRPLDTNSQTTAWIYSPLQKGERLPLSYPEYLILLPLTWASPTVSTNTVAYFKDFFEDSSLFPSFASSNYPAGVYKTDQTDANGRLSSRTISTFVDPDSKKYPIALYNIDFTNYVNISNVFVPLAYSISDKRTGLGLNKTYLISITNHNYATMDISNAYPDISAFITYVQDQRLGEAYYYSGKPWPASYAIAGTNRPASYPGKW